MNKQSLKKEINKYKNKSSEILKYFEKKGYSEDNVAEYACISMIPVYVIFSLLKENSYDINISRIKDLCDFYSLEEDYFE